MPYTQEELTLFETVKNTGICHEQPIEWKRFDDGTGVATPVPKAKGYCKVCLREYIKNVQIVDLEQI